MFYLFPELFDFGKFIRLDEMDELNPLEPWQSVLFLLYFKEQSFLEVLHSTGSPQKMKSHCAVFSTVKAKRCVFSIT